jgi:hypothetical protein
VALRNSQRLPHSVTGNAMADWEIDERRHGFSLVVGDGCAPVREMTVRLSCTAFHR